ncbi:DUF1232 domain-containing protein [Desulfobulbus rhabdoformis]|jgi:uncharacterized membrane protein YkvA (DUF1232 family)|uniref:YkvA family protein n=1 Tax=Desulfobulbus rhabdoformis TaxID=34032 RepID=UPI00196482B3|nr:DUF1232 domain-containing protein [Desulfobulbus rhabdoformis]MBM9613423.1 DUF1232 domain-containing protein [Desulfobulbus rhabdoformis]
MQLPPQIARFWRMFVHAKDVFVSPATPLYVKVVLAFGILYALSPYDLLPDWMPLIGVVDDLALVALLISWANRFSTHKRN